MPSTFFLQPHVFLCRANRHWVILDVNRDKYLCVDRQQFESLGPWLYGWEETPAQGVRTVPEPPDDAAALGDALLAVDILSERRDGAKYARATACSLPTDAPDADLPAHLRRSPWAHALTFFMSSATASRQLRDQRFQSIVASVQTRKHQKKRNCARSFDFERTRSLTAVFASLRLFYPRPYLCMFDSLALLNFLAHFGSFPDWVFGVTADPFEAHCWVQAGSTVLNDTLQRVSAFTPIMRV